MMTECLRKMGGSPKLLKTTRTLKCQKCGHEFSLLYARAIACRGCPEAVLGCEYARCPRCDNEFAVNEIGLASTKAGKKELAAYASNIVSGYYRDFGESPSR